MGDPFGSYPLSEQQGALFERNPVCSLCYRVCAKQSKRHGGMNFPIVRSLEEADDLCEQIICKAWNLPHIDQIYHWLESRLNGCELSIGCTVATVCVTLNCIEELPEPARELTDDLLGLLSGNGYKLYDTLNSEACRLSINISAITYGLPPPKPDALVQIELLQQENTRLTKHNKQLEKTIKSMEQEQEQGQRPIVKKFYGPYIENNNLSGGNQILAAENVYLPGAENVSISHAKNIQPSQTDSRLKRLFLTPDGNEDFERTEEERNRFRNFLSDHCLGQEILNSSQDHIILKAAVCFCTKWKSLHLIPTQVSAVAVVRFLIQTCGISNEGTSERAISNAVARMLKTTYDKNLYYEVQEYF